MNFASENYDKVHPRILNSLIRCNKDFVTSYGKDQYTKKATTYFEKILGRKDIEVVFCFNGTGANNLALSTITQRQNSILCSDSSHIYIAESTAPETFTGCRLYPVKSIGGKIIIPDLESKLAKRDGVHFPFAATLSISQPTEYGTIYSADELKEISALCKKHRVMLHVDGARIFNALAKTNCSFSEFVKLSGVDAVTIGGTKSGLMFGEAVIFFKSQRFKNISLDHKRSMQLASKNRYIAAQFEELLRNELWKSIADHTNGLAQYFKKRIEKIDGSQVAELVETNMVFMKMKPALFAKLKATANFYMWDKETEIARFAFSFSNTRKEIDIFLKSYKKIPRLL